MLTKSRGFKFVSCYAERYISFGFYIAPFQPLTWLLIVISLVSIISAVLVYTKARGTVVLTSSYSTWLSVLAILLDDSVKAPNKLEECIFYRSIFVHWGPVAIILSNCYTGLMITELNSHLKGLRPESFDDLVCNKSYLALLEGINGFLINKTRLKLNIEKYSITMPTDFSKSIEIDDNVSLEDNCFDMLSIPANSQFKYQNPYSTDMWYVFQNAAYEFRRAYIYENGSPTRSMFIQYVTYLKMQIHPRRISIEEEPTRYAENCRQYAEEEVANCEKSVFVGEVDNVNYEMKYLSRKYPRQKFAISKETMHDDLVGWSFHGGGKSTVRRNLYAIVESGIYKMLQHERYSRGYSKRTRNNHAEGTSNIEIQMLNGSLLTLFILCSILSTIALICLIFENYQIMLTFCGRTFTLCYTKLKVCIPVKNFIKQTNVNVSRISVQLF